MVHVAGRPLPPPPTVTVALAVLPLPPALLGITVKLVVAATLTTWLLAAVGVTTPAPLHV